MSRQRQKIFTADSGTPRCHHASAHSRAKATWLERTKPGTLKQPAQPLPAGECHVKDRKYSPPTAGLHDARTPRRTPGPLGSKGRSPAHPNSQLSHFPLANFTSKTENIHRRQRDSTMPGRLGVLQGHLARKDEARHTQTASSATSRWRMSRQRQKIFTADSGGPHDAGTPRRTPGPPGPKGRSPAHSNSQLSHFPPVNVTSKAENIHRRQRDSTMPPCLGALQGHLARKDEARHTQTANSATSRR